MGTIGVEWVAASSMSLVLGLRMRCVTMEIMDEFLSFRLSRNVNAMIWLVILVPWSLCIMRMICWLRIAMCGTHEVKIWLSWLVSISFRSVVATFGSNVRSG